MRAVVGLGDPERGDDGVGARVLALMKPSADVFRLQPSEDMLSLLELGRPCPHMILIDSARSEAAPGTLLTLELTGPISQAIRRDGKNVLGHFRRGRDLAQLLLMAGDMGQIPERITLYGIVGESFGKGASLSPAVERAAQELAKKLS